MAPSEGRDQVLRSVIVKPIEAAQTESIIYTKLMGIKKSTLSITILIGYNPTNPASNHSE